MAIDRKDLSEKQLLAIGQLYSRHQRKMLLSVTIYLIALFMANYVVVLLDSFFVHNDLFRIFLSIGTTILLLTGFRGVRREQEDEFEQRMKEITEEK